MAKVKFNDAEVASIEELSTGALLITFTDGSYIVVGPIVASSSDLPAGESADDAEEDDDEEDDDEEDDDEEADDDDDDEEADEEDDEDDDEEDDEDEPDYSSMKVAELRELVVEQELASKKEAKKLSKDECLELLEGDEDEDDEDDDDDDEDEDDAPDYESMTKAELIDIALEEGLIKNKKAGKKLDKDDLIELLTDEEEDDDDDDDDEE